jgi:uncharacterized protein YjbI with pentapeptide repeats
MENLTAFARERTHRLAATTLQAFEQRVAQRAYFKWLDAGRPEGCAKEFWAQAVASDVDEPLAADVAAVLAVIFRRSERMRRRERANQRSLNFNGAVFRRAVFNGAHLEGASFREACLERSDLSRAYLNGAILNGAHLEGADLRWSHLERAHLEGAHLKGTDLRYAHLQGAFLQDAVLEGARLDGARFDGAMFDRVNFRQINIREANFRNAYLQEAYLEGANLADAQLAGAYIAGANLIGTFLRAANLEKASLRHANLEGVNLRKAKLTGAYLGGANLSGADLSYADLTGASFEPSGNYDEKETDLSGAHLFGVCLVDAVGLTASHVANSIGDSDTKLPAGLQAPAHWLTTSVSSDVSGGEASTTRGGATIPASPSLLRHRPAMVPGKPAAERGFLVRRTGASPERN